MAELEWEGRPERPILRRAIRHRLRRFDPTIRVVAEGFLAESSAIDLLAIGGEGEIISIRIGRGGDDVPLFTRCLADLTWLRPRLADFLKLAPGLGLECSADPRAMLFSPDFAPETRAAVDPLPARSIELLTYRCFRQHGQLSVLLESVNPFRQPSTERLPPAVPLSDARVDRDQPRSRTSRSDLSVEDSPRSPGFRTGLEEADLHIEVAEEEKFLD